MSLDGPSTVSLGETFILSVNADPAPNVEIGAFGSEVLFPEGLKWEQRAGCADELQVERADGGAIALCNSFIPILTGGAAHAVLSEFNRPAGALDVAPGGTALLLELDFVCNTPGSYKLTLTAVPDSVDGALFGGTDGREIRVGTIQQDYDGDTAANQVADTLFIDCVVQIKPLGDVSCDLAVTIADAQLIAQLIVGRIGALPCAENGDVNESGGVTIADAQLIAQLIVGRIPSLPPP